MATCVTVLYDASGPRAQCFNRTLTWVMTTTIVTILAQVRMKLTNKGQLEPNKWLFFLESTTWTTCILPDLVSTIIAVVVFVVLALVIDALLGVGRLGPIAPVRQLCSVIVRFFCVILALMLMLFAHSVFATWQLFPSSHLGFAVAVFGLTMCNDSVIDETLRFGIKLPPEGQREIATALNLSHHQIVVTILLPQAVIAMLPVIISQMIIALKDSALGYVAGYVEVVRSGRQLGEYYSTMIPSLAVVAIILIAISFGLANLAERIEGQLRIGRACRNIIAEVPHQRDVGVTTRDETNVDWHAEGHRDLRGTHK